MIGVHSIASYIPSSGIDNIEQAEKFDTSSDFVEKKIGALFLPIKDVRENTSDLAFNAVKALLTKSSLKVCDIDALVVVTQNPDGFGLPHTSAILQNMLGIKSQVAAFDISLGCSGYVYGLSILKGLMEQCNYNNGVLVTADPYSKVINREDRNTSLLFGDAATATLLCNQGEWKFGSPLLETDGSGSDSLYKDEHEILKMNGRDIFNFAAQKVPRQIDALLKLRNLRYEDIDLFCLHQGSAAILDTISRRFPSVKERFVKDIQKTGNTVSSSIPILLEKYITNSKRFNKILISGFGVGLSWGSNILEKKQND